MHRGIARTIISSRPGIAVAALGLAALAGGCAANGGDEGMLVLKNVVPMATTGGCMVTGMATETGLVGGTLDIKFGGGYIFIAQIESKITAVVGQEAQRTIFTRGANVELTFADKALFSAAEITDLNSKNLLQFLVPFTAPVSPNGGITDAPFELIPVDLATALMAKTFTSTVIQANFTVVGDMSGGNVSSQAFGYPVTVVNGGLIDNAGACSTLSTSFTPRIGNPCNLGQDGAIDCCTDATSHLICPAKGTGM